MYGGTYAHARAHTPTRTHARTRTRPYAYPPAPMRVQSVTAPLVHRSSSVHGHNAAKTRQNDQQGM